MRLIAFHFVSGDSIFLGTGVLALAGAAALTRRPRIRLQRVVRLVSLIGAVWVALSAIPLPLWFYTLWATTLAGLLYVIRRQGPGHNSNQRAAVFAPVLLLSATVAAVVWEIVERIPPSLQNKASSGLYVIGDSLSAGDEGTPENCWPAFLQSAHQVRVVNFAWPGATARSAFKQAERVTDARAVVLVEIGGNDLLSGVSSRQFARDLEGLLRVLAQPQRKLVMLELPLPPFYNGYGLAQRRLAKRFGVRLVPRRVLAKALFQHGATTDGLHLSPAGHQLMADAMWDHVGPMLSPMNESPKSIEADHK